MLDESSSMVIKGTSTIPDWEAKAEKKECKWESGSGSFGTGYDGQPGGELFHHGFFGIYRERKKGTLQLKL